MDKLLIGLGAALLGLVVIAVAAFLGGTIVFWIWPAVVPYMVNTVFGLSVVVGPLLWWKAVLFTWLCGILFKGSGSTSSGKSN
jgi:hypothetical protein